MKNLTKTSYTLLAAAVAALIGMLIYIFTSVTGYLAASPVNPLPILCTIAALLLLLGIVYCREKIPALYKDLGCFLAMALLLISFYYFVLGRVGLAADVYFIPVNYPQSEASALHISIVGVVFYLVAGIAMITAAFTEKETN